MGLYRQLITRLLEARRLVQAHENHPEIAEFTAPNGLKLGPVDLGEAYARPSDDERNAAERSCTETRVTGPCTTHRLGSQSFAGSCATSPAAGKDGHVGRRGREASAGRVSVGHRCPSSGLRGAEPWAAGMAEHLRNFGQRRARFRQRGSC